MRTLLNEPNPKSTHSLLELIKELPGLLVGLAKAEVAQLKAELSQKATRAGIGIGLFVGAALFGFLALCVLIAAAILGIAVALPAWLAALIVGVALLLLAGILAMIGMSSLKKAMPPKPEKTLESIHQDLNAIKGLGRYER
ncbi:MAG: phage holin family protein [Microbacteriaceae bacterium]